MLDNSLGIIQIAVAITITFVGSTVFSTIGFGIGVTSIPILLLVFDPQTAVIVINTVSLLMFVLVIYQTREHIQLREAMPIIIAGLVGMPIGVFILGSVDSSVLKIGIASAIIALTLLGVFNVGVPLVKSKITGPVVGLIVSILLNAFGIGGALILLFALARDWQRHAVRGTLALYFLVVEGAGVIGYGVSGLFTLERGLIVLIVIIPVALGFGFATLIHRRLNETIFRRLAVGLIIVSSLVILGREIV